MMWKHENTHLLFHCKMRTCTMNRKLRFIINCYFRFYSSGLTTPSPWHSQQSESWTLSTTWGQYSHRFDSLPSHTYISVCVCVRVIVYKWISVSVPRDRGPQCKHWCVWPWARPVTRLVLHFIKLNGPLWSVGAGCWTLPLFCHQKDRERERGPHPLTQTV